MQHKGEKIAVETDLLCKLLKRKTEKTCGDPSKTQIVLPGMGEPRIVKIVEASTKSNSIPELDQCVASSHILFRGHWVCSHPSCVRRYSNHTGKHKEVQQTYKVGDAKRDIQFFAQHEEVTPDEGG